jgi:hypothetical protein
LLIHYFAAETFQKPNMQKSLFLFALVLALCSCEKFTGENCAPPDRIEITTNSPVVVGWPLYLTGPDRHYLYHWKGPNGFDKKYSYYSSVANGEIRNNIVAADAGEYSLELLDENGCVAYRGVTTVQVITTPTPPCTLAANTGTSTSIGVGSGNNYSVYVFGTHVEGNLPGQSININFPGTTPKTGIYKTSGYYPQDEESIGLVISLFPYDFISESDQLVYVNKIGGKLDISFCNHQFTNPLGSTKIKSSVRLVQN